MPTPAGPVCVERLGSDWVDSGTIARTRHCPPGPSLVIGKDISVEIGASFQPIQTSLTLRPAEMQVFAALRHNMSLIVDSERIFNIDRRAIAGAIAYEMLGNPEAKSKLPGHWVGWGKVHLYNLSAADPFPWTDTIAEETENRGYLPKQTSEHRRNVLASPAGAIRYIAAIMAAIADIAGAFGYDIRWKPILLTNVYNGQTLKRWEEHLRKKPRGETLKGGNKMDIWVERHMGFLEEAVGLPAIFSIVPHSIDNKRTQTDPTKLPLDQRAVATANQELWTKFPELNGRQLTSTDDIKYRSFWMDQYEKARATPRD
jgi:hypothetical protein